MLQREEDGLHVLVVQLVSRDDGAAGVDHAVLELHAVGRVSRCLVRHVAHLVRLLDGQEVDHAVFHQRNGVLVRVEAADKDVFSAELDERGANARGTVLVNGEDALDVGVCRDGIDALGRAEVDIRFAVEGAEDLDVRIASFILASKPVTRSATEALRENRRRCKPGPLRPSAQPARPLPSRRQRRYRS